MSPLAILSGAWRPFTAGLALLTPYLTSKQACNWRIDESSGVHPFSILRPHSVTPYTPLASGYSGCRRRLPGGVHT